MVILLSAACSGGGGNAKATFKISSNFAVTNGAFTGGLVITGKSASGQLISIPMVYSSPGASEVNMTLPKGSWNFKAVGWNGSPMQGDSQCGNTDVSIKDNAQTVTINVSAGGCNTPEFGANGTLAGSFIFKPMRFITCGSLYENVASNIPVTSATDYSSYCSAPAGMPEDMRKPAKSVQISIPVALPAGTTLATPIVPICVDLDGNGTNSITPVLNIPAAGLPLNIKLFDGLGCPSLPDNLMTEYLFLEGLGITYSDFNHVVSNLVGTETFLHLPTSNVRRGFSPNLGLLPVMTCSSGPCINLPTLPVGIDRVIGQNQDFVLDMNATTYDCSSIILTSSATGYSFTPSTMCREEDGKIIVRINWTPGTCTTPCTLTVGNAPTFTLNFKENSNRSADIYSELFDTLGIDAAGAPVLLSFMSNYGGNGNQDKDKKSAGILSNIRDHFIPDGPSGFLPIAMSCALDDEFRTASFYEKGTLKTYQVQISASGEPIPNYICNDADPLDLSCSSYFQRKMVLRSVKVPGNPITESVLHYDCSPNRGMLEEQEIKYESDGSSRDDRSLTYYNTADENTHRVEKYFYQVEKAADNTEKRTNTGFKRVEKQNAANLVIISNTYNSNFASSNFQQNISRKSIQMVSNSYAYMQDVSASFSDTANNTIFNEPYFQDPLKFQAPSNTATESVAYDQNGVEYRAWSIPVGANFNLSFSVQAPGSPAVVETVTMSATTLRMKVVANQNGRAVVAWQNQSGTFAITWNGSVWENITGTAFIVASPATAQISAAVGVGLDVTYHSPVSNNFSVIWGEGYFSNIKTYSAGSWGAVQSLDSGNVSYMVKSLRIVPETGGTNYHVIGVTALSNTIKIFSKVCSNLITLSCTPATPPTDLTTGPYASHETFADTSVANSVKFFIQLTTPGGSDLVNQYVTTSGIISAAVTVSGMNRVRLTDKKCENVVSGSNLGTAAGSCAPVEASRALPVNWNVYKNDAKSLNPSTFMNMFSPPASFQAQ